MLRWRIDPDCVTGAPYGDHMTTENTFDAPNRAPVIALADPIDRAMVLLRAAGIDFVVLAEEPALAA